MSSDGSVTRLIDQLKARDEVAVRKLWERYFHQLVFLARKKLKSMAQRMADEEDVALNAFDSFCRDTWSGAFPKLDDRKDLWRLLATLTAQKAVDLVRHEQAQKRGADQENKLGDEALHTMLSKEPTPELAAQVADQFQELLDRLDDPILRALAWWKFEGHTNEEIATQLRTTCRTVERKLQKIRECWSQQVPE